MAKVKSPILSISARGQIGKSQVYGSWRGVAYARQHVTPANPNTTAQQLTRNTLDSLMEQYKRTGPLGREPWLSATTGRPLTDRNQVVKTNLPGLRAAADMTGYQASPGSLSGLPPTGVVAAANATAGEIDVTVTSPQEPAGWLLTSISAIAFPDRAPTSLPTAFVSEVESLAPVADGDTVLTFAGLTSGTLYVVSAWPVWTRPDGREAFGASLTDTATPV